MKMVTCIFGFSQRRLIPHAGHFPNGCRFGGLGKKGGKYLANHVTGTWLEKGYLYYTWNDRSGGDGKLNLSVLNAETKQLETEALTERGGAWLQTVGDDFVVEVDIYRNMEKEKAVYFRYKAGVLPLERLGREEKWAENG